jgi:MarR family transcriptional regulator, transcriptional regulator for hemolysin
MDSNYRRDTSAGYLTNWAARSFTRALERRLAGGGAGQMPVFFALFDGESQTQTEVSRVAAVEQPTMANTLQRMERDGLVVRTPDPMDKRSARVALTKLGLKHAGIALAAAETTNALGLSALSLNERPVFLDMMKRIIATLETDEG